MSWLDYIDSSEKYAHERGEEKTCSLYPRHPMNVTVDVDFDSFETHQDYPLRVV